MEMVTAFCVFANSGIKTKPYAIKMIKDRNGKVLEETVPFYEPVLSPETAYIITSALSGVIERGTAHPVLRGVFSQDIAGKTGTTDEFVDAWFIGYTPELCCGIWIGYDEGRKSLGRKQSGCVVAAPVFRDFMKEALKLLPKTRFTPPDNITFCMIDRNTGLLATDACENQFYEVFIAGTEPKEYCEDCRKFDKLKFEEWNF
jgi:penicillin-binding protein 1A